MDRLTAPELLDTLGPGYSTEELRRNLGHIRLVNRFLGGTRASLMHIKKLAGSAGLKRLDLLDVGTGTADIPLAAAGWCRSLGIDVRVTCLDISERILREAVNHAGGDAALAFTAGDGLRLPFGDGAFDVAHTSHTLHHFTDEDAAAFLREMARVSRVGLVANDLVRSRAAQGLIRAITAMCTRNRLTLHDAPMSVARAFRPDELSDVAVRSGIPDYSVHTHPFWRMVLVGARG